MRHRIRFAAWACLVGTALCGAARAEAWPELRMPPNAATQMIASEMLLNGKPCRLVRFNVRSSDADVLAFYRAELGAKRVVENRLKNDSVIATRQGDYFVTVQLHALDSQTVQGTVLTTLLTAKPASSAVLIDTQKVLPAETQVISTVQTADAGKRSLIVIGVNLNSVRANRDHVVGAMLERGFRSAKAEAALDERDPSFVSLQLSAPGEEASVTISDDGTRRAVVINRVREASR